MTAVESLRDVPGAGPGPTSHCRRLSRTWLLAGRVSGGARVEPGRRDRRGPDRCLGCGCERMRARESASRSRERRRRRRDRGTPCAAHRSSGADSWCSSATTMSSKCVRSSSPSPASPRSRSEVVEACEVGSRRVGRRARRRASRPVVSERQVGACACPFGLSALTTSSEERSVVLLARQLVKRGETRGSLIAVGGDQLKPCAGAARRASARPAAALRAKAAWAVWSARPCVPEARARTVAPGRAPTPFRESGATSAP